MRSISRFLVRSLALVAVVVSLAAPGTAFAKPQEKCPVMGGAIDPSVYADYEGQRVYFCCKGCVAKFKADPAKYLAKLAADGVEPEKVPEGAAAVPAAAGGCGCGKDCACGCGCAEGKACDCGRDCKCGCGCGGADKACACGCADGKACACGGEGKCGGAKDAKGCGCGKAK